MADETQGTAEQVPVPSDTVPTAECGYQELQRRARALGIRPMQKKDVLLALVLEREREAITAADAPETVLDLPPQDGEQVATPVLAVPDAEPLTATPATVEDVPTEPEAEDLAEAAGPPGEPGASEAPPAPAASDEAADDLPPPVGGGWTFVSRRYSSDQQILKGGVRGWTDVRTGNTVDPIPPTIAVFENHICKIDDTPDGEGRKRALKLMAGEPFKKGDIILKADQDIAGIVAKMADVQIGMAQMQNKPVPDRAKLVAALTRKVTDDLGIKRKVRVVSGARTTRSITPPTGTYAPGERSPDGGFLRNEAYLDRK